MQCATFVGQACTQSTTQYTPTPMKTIETIMRKTFSTRATALSQVETLATPKDISVPNTKTGSPVPRAYTAGSATPLLDLRAKGINTPKNRTAL